MIECHRRSVVIELPCSYGPLPRHPDDLASPSSASEELPRAAPHRAAQRLLIGDAGVPGSHQQAFLRARSLWKALSFPI
jgi:hypothetical protein